MRKRLLWLTVLGLTFGLGCSGGGGGGGEPTPEPPRILSGPVVKNLTTGSATIEWTTDKDCNSKVRFGTSSAYDDSVTSSQLTVSHSLVLTGLDPNTVYHYMAISEDADGRSVSSNHETFQTPDIGPPTITSGPTVTDITVTGADIQWATDRSCDSKVRYGKSEAYTDSVFAGAFLLDHSLSLSDLDTLAVYHFQVVSEDPDGRWVASVGAPFSTLSPAGDLIDEGWDFFEAGQLEPALEKLEAAYSYEPQNVGVLEALGWVLLKLYRFESSEPGDLTARTVFEDALFVEPERVDCLVGIAFVYHALQRYEDAVEVARDAIRVGGETYEFSHADPGEITISDVRYVLILSLMADGDLMGALDEIKILDPSVDLDPEDRDTWGGAASFEEALLAIIESLGTQI